MAYRIKDLNRQIPNGYKFLQPETGWSPRRFASFMSICNGLMQHRLGNKFLAEKHKWPTDLPTIQLEVEAYNVKVCLAHGWNDYLTKSEGEGDPQFPKFTAPPPSFLEKVRNVAVGAETLIEWIASGKEAVERDLADRRAMTCVVCPLNDPGDWTRWFTIPVTRAISKALEKRREWKLATISDDRLGVCSACTCPMKLKVHMPLDQILARIAPDTMNRLDPKCWILEENNAKFILK